MKYIKENPIALVASNILEDEYPAYSLSADYVTTNTIVYAHRIYEALASNGASSTVITPGTDPLTWQDNGATNLYSPFDIFVSTKAQKAEYIEYTFTCGPSDVIALFNLTGTDIVITQIDNSTAQTIGTYNISLLTSDINDFGDYFFGELEYKDRIIYSMPLFFDTKITVRINNTGGVAAVGLIVAGRLSDLGVTLWSPKTGIDDYSKKAISASGHTYLQQGNYAEPMTLTGTFPTSHTDTIKKRFISLRAKATVYIGSASFESMIVYGFYETFEALLVNPTSSTYTISIKGLI